MDGYSVNEAASVLGVPVERVWELLARGVLSGTPEGETGMRVFLRPRPGPSEAQLDAPAPRGNGATETERELSPFRELLTEFRNLTERYGQALLALGESRGEVAALRSRVDLLEARMDLGQPAPASAPRPRGWWPGAGPYPTEETVVPAQPAPEETAAPEEAAEAFERTEPDEPAEPDAPAESDEHRAKPRGARRATESFAEAIARAQDPSLPDLPEPEIPHTERQATAERGIEPPSDADLPRDLPAADTVPVADELAVAAEEPEAPGGAASAEGLALAEELADAAIELEPEIQAPQPEAEAVARQPFETAEPLEWDTERYTTAIEEPDWFEAEAEARADAQPAPHVETAGETPIEPQTAERGSADEPGEAFPGAGDLRSALDALGVGRQTNEPASEPINERVPAAQAGPLAPTPAPRPEPSGLAAPPVPPSALRYRPVAPAGPTGRAYRRLRRIFPS